MNTKTRATSTAAELSAIRDRFKEAQTGTETFISWLSAHMVDDFRWLLGTLDGYLENEESRNNEEVPR